MDIDELLSSPAFWILGGGGIAAEILGFIMSKKMGIEAFPIWQLLVVMFGTLVAAAFFAMKE